MRQEGTFVNANGKAQMNSNPYSRAYGPDFSDDAGTYVPGMHDDAPGIKSEMVKEVNSTPVVGFLYSISRKGIGEYWPLHLGTNVIGRASDCDIRLHEMTVSEHHASILIKQMKSTHRLIASIRDLGSSNGIYVNEEELDYENHSCKANDIIVIGRCYKLLLLLVDAEQVGLSIAEDFVPTNDNSIDNVAGQDFTHSNYNPYSSDERRVETGTVDLSGDQFCQPGRTTNL